MIVFIINKIIVKDYTINRSRLFFTFPKSEITAELLIQRLTFTRFFGDKLEYIIVGREQHKDKTPHLHVLIQLNKAHNFSLNGIKRCLLIKHFNDAGRVRSIKDTLVYVTKDDDVLCWPSDLKWWDMIENLKAKKRTKGDIIVEKLVAETDHTKDSDEFITDLLDDELISGTVVYRTKSITEAYKIYHGTKLKNLPVKEVTLPGMNVDWMLMQNPATQAIWTWLSMRVRKEMKLGDKHLFIYGPTKSGKSSLINYLVDLGLKLFFIPKKEIYFNGIEKQRKWDIAIMDEVKGGDQTIQFWNQWCDKIMPLAIKGKEYYLKAQIIPTIIISNYSPMRLFPKIAADQPDILEAFERRWEIQEVGGTAWGCIDLPI